MSFLILIRQRTKSFFRLLFADKIDKKSEEIKRIKSIGRYHTFTTTIFGVPFKGIDSLSFIFIYKEIIESKIYSFKSLKPNPVIIDCGANVGIGIIFFKNLYPESEIIAFEPDKKVFNALYENMQSMGFRDVKLINKGLWNDETELKFYSEGADGGRVAQEGDVQDITIIETVRLKDFLNREIDFLKMDIEGAETEVLEDCKDFLINVKNIFVEYHSFIGKAQTLHKILDFLFRAGFRIYISTPGMYQKNPFMKIDSYLGMDMQLNIYGIRE